MAHAASVQASTLAQALVTVSRAAAILGADASGAADAVEQTAKSLLGIAHFASDRGLKHEEDALAISGTRWSPEQRVSTPLTSQDWPMSRQEKLTRIVQLSNWIQASDDNTAEASATLVADDGKRNLGSTEQSNADNAEMFATNPASPYTVDVAEGQPFALVPLESLRKIGGFGDSDLAPSVPDGVFTGAITPLLPSGILPPASNVPCMGPPLE